MKTLETIAAQAKSKKITEVYGAAGWTKVNLDLTMVAINTLADFGARIVCIGNSDYGISELVGLPDGEFSRIDLTSLQPVVFCGETDA